MKYLLIVLLLVIFVSCNILENPKVVCETLTLTEETLPPVQPLKLEKMELCEDYTMGNSSCFVYQDSILLVLKNGNPYPLTHMLTLVNLNNGEQIGKYFSQGRGPRELLSVLARLSNNYLDMKCYVMGRLVAFNIDSAITKGNNYEAPVFVLGEHNLGSEWASVDDTTFLTTNRHYFDKSKDCQENANLPEFYFINLNGKLSPEYDLEKYKKVKYLTSDVSGSTISVNKSNNRIVCCYYYQPCIKIFDSKMNLLKCIIGPEPDDGKYEPFYGENSLYFSKDNGINHYYTSASCGVDNIFVLNRRTHKYMDDVLKINETENNTREIFRLDWNGNVIGRYSVKGKQLMHVNYCEDSNILYLWVSENGGGTMYKAKLD